MGNRVFKITAHGIGRSGRLKVLKKRIYESEQKFHFHCIGDRSPDENTYERYKRCYHAVKLWELIDGKWKEFKRPEPL